MPQSNTAATAPTCPEEATDAAKVAILSAALSSQWDAVKI
jgi:hypothetical protein